MKQYARMEWLEAKLAADERGRDEARAEARRLSDEWGLAVTNTQLEQELASVLCENERLRGLLQAAFDTIDEERRNLFIEEGMGKMGAMLPPGWWMRTRVLLAGEPEAPPESDVVEFLRDARYWIGRSPWDDAGESECYSLTQEIDALLSSLPDPDVGEPKEVDGE